MAGRVVGIMAGRARPDLPLWVVGAAYGALALVLLLTLGAVSAVAWRGATGLAVSSTDWAVVRFTLFQAALSAFFSIALAIPVARALARRRFAGRRTVITLMGAPFILPVIVAVMGLLAVFGRNGVLNRTLEALDIAPISIFGLHGIVLAHVFFNMPLATRLVLQGWQAIPSERFRLAGTLAFGPSQVFRHLELPMLKSVLPKAFVLTFLVCLTSFAIALTLGGGPRATTIELAIYQAFTFDFDLARASRLAILQLCVGLMAGALALRLSMPVAFGPGFDRRVERWDATSRLSIALDWVFLGGALVFLILPLVMIIARGLPFLAELDPFVIGAALRSLAVAIASVFIVIACALPLALWASTARSWVVEGSAVLLVAISPLVMGTGLFLIVFPVVDPARVALGVTALVNAAAALPFALRALIPAVATAEADFGRLAQSLSMSPTARVRLVVLPRIRGPLAFACGLTAALSMGDLGVIVLFAGSDTPTLPLMIYRLMGSYQMDAAAGASLLLLGLSLGAFWVIDRAGGRMDD